MAGTLIRTTAISASASTARSPYENPRHIDFHFHHHGGILKSSFDIQLSSFRSKSKWSTLSILINVFVLVVAQERREYAKLSPSLRALVLQRLCEANMEARDHVRTWMTDDTEVDDLRCEVRSPQILMAIHDLLT